MRGSSFARLSGAASLCAVLTGFMASAGTAQAADPPKREVPDYDGRGTQTTGGDVLLWVPRLVLSPLYFVSEYVIRRPLGAFVSWAERSNVPKFLYDLFTFGPDHSSGFAPIGFIDFGFNPSVGLYVFSNDAFFKGNDLNFHATTWGADWIGGVVSDRIRFDEDQSVTLKVTGVRRPDLRFAGSGPDSLDSNNSRYGQDLIDVDVLYDRKLWRSSRVTTWTGMKTVSFYDGRFGDDIGIQEAVRQGKYGLPDGFTNGYTAQYNGLRLSFDTRQRPPASQSGVRVEFEAQESNDVRRSPGAAWLKYGGGVGGFLDLGDSGRVVSASVTTQFADPLGNEPVPFTELASVGGDGPMRGFIPGRLRGRSAATATLRYRWPIWVNLDGAMEASVGNVFDEHLSGFSAKKLRLSTALGIETVGSPDSAFQFLLGLGTETFEQGTRVDTFRLVIGTNRGF